MCVLTIKRAFPSANDSCFVSLVVAALLLQVRFGDPIDKNQEALDDAIDSTPVLLFWLQWTFVPWWPIKNVAQLHFRDAHTFLDDIFLMCSYIGITLDIVMFLSVSSISDAANNGMSAVRHKLVLRASLCSFYGM
jgi:hypothetical protein